MFIFSWLTEKSLLNAGWLPGRKMGIEAYKNKLLAKGYMVFPSVEKFLLEFGGLHLNFLVRNGAGSDLHFNVIQAIEEIDPIWVRRDYYNRLGERNICVIGQAHSDHMTIMMDELGSVYAGFDDYLAIIAKSGEEAIETICTNKPFTEIP